MKNILVPTDFSSEASYALNFALQMAKQVSGTVHLLNVVEIPVTAAVDPLGAPRPHDWGVEFVKTVTEQNKDTLNKIVAEIDSDLDIITKSDVGIMLETTTDYIEENDIDLVVMGTKGATGLKEIFVGSNAEKVVRYASCPVITVGNPTPLKDIEDMIFGLDVEGEINPRVTEQLKVLQEALGLKIHFVYINTPHVIVNEGEVIEKLRNYVRENEFENYTVNVHKGSVSYAGMIEFAKKMSADLIGMCTRSQTGLAHLITGSMAEDVVNHSPLPVWTISLKD